MRVPFSPSYSSCMLFLMEWQRQIWPHINTFHLKNASSISTNCWKSIISISSSALWFNLSYILFFASSYESFFCTRSFISFLPLSRCKNHHADSDETQPHHSANFHMPADNVKLSFMCMMLRFDPPDNDLFSCNADMTCLHM